MTEERKQKLRRLMMLMNILNCCLQFMELSTSFLTDPQLRAILFQSASHIREWYITPKDSHFRNFSLLNETLFIEADFRCAFRMSRASVEKLLQKIQPFLEKQVTRFRNPVPASHRLLIFLYHVSKPATYSVIHDLFAYGKSTISKIIHETTLAIIDHLRPIYISWPSIAEMMRTSHKFYRKHGIPQCIGCIDGSHFPIRRPKRYGDTYYCRKGFYSINGQGKY